MRKSATIAAPKDLLERLYAEAEARIEAKFNHRIDALEKTVADLRRECDDWKEEAHVWKAKYYAEQKRAEKLEGQLSLARTEIKELKALVQKQATQITGLQKQLFGRKTEVVEVEQKEEPLPEKRRRGRQPGTKGSGRRKRPELKPVEKIHQFEPHELVCPCCSLPFEDAGEKRSEEIDFEVLVTRVVHRRKTVRKTCKCPTTPTVKTPLAPARLFKGSSFSVGVWQFVIHDKYHLQRPLNRSLKYLESHGLPIGSSVIVNGLKRLHGKQVFKPLVNAIAARVKASPRQQKDETGWKIFQEIDGKEGYQHWLWAALANDCAFFEIDPSRSREVAKHTIGEDPVVLTTDMLKVYHNLGDNVTNSWCWAHVRRYLKTLPKSSASWIAKVDWLYHCNNLRLKAKTQAEFESRESELRTALREFERQAKSNAKRNSNEESRKVFRMIADHWHGLALFADFPEVPMDNNLSEQALRNAVIGRKCYYGSGACWSGELAADLFSIFTTLEMNGINTRTWLHEYLTAVAANNGKAPENAADFLPWNSPPVHVLSN